MQSNIELNDPRPDFVAVESFLRGLGLDVGPGTNRLSPTVLCSDWYPHKGVDLVWNCVHDGGRYPYPFRENTFDFIFASHVLEDFEVDQIQWMFDELLRMIKPGGYLVTIGPDMQNSRYPKWDEKFTAESPEVISGKRQIGELCGNPSHRFDWGLDFCYKLKNESAYKTEVVQEDTIPHDTMSIDFVIKKL